MANCLTEFSRVWAYNPTLAWIEDPLLRRRVTAGLNKGEARNSLAKAVFFNRLGEVRDRSFDNQRYRASGLNLVVGCNCALEYVLSRTGRGCAGKISGC
jgi:TnpA family transposase